MSETFKPPLWLDKVGREYFKRIAPALLEQGLLNSVTFDLICSGCQSYSTYRMAVAKLKEEGQVVASKTGALKCNPWGAVERQAFTQLCRVYKELGTSKPIAVPQDELDQFLIEDK